MECIWQNIKEKLYFLKRWKKQFALVFHHTKPTRSFCSRATLRCDDDPHNRHFRYEFKGENTPACCSTHLYEILREVGRTLRKEGINFFIAYGTLLGAVRHHGMIPWDTDVDIMIDDVDIERAFTLLKQTLGKRFHIYYGRVHCRTVGRVIRVDYSYVNTLHVDIFSYVREGDTIIMDTHEPFAVSDIFPLRYVNYYDLSLPAPHNIEAHLTRFFGHGYMERAYRQWARSTAEFELHDFAPAPIESRFLESKS
jgi:hypothetical protein